MLFGFRGDLKIKLVSACLLGVNCRYDSRNNFNRRISQLFAHEVLIPICPEQLGGLSTPRDPMRIVGGTGSDVLDGKARIMSKRGIDVTENLKRGAKEVLKVARLLSVKDAIMKKGSPSCECNGILNYALPSGCVIGDGVTTAYLKRNNIRIIADDELDK